MTSRARSYYAAQVLAQLGEVTLEFDDAGDGMPVLLLHGFPTSRRLWDGVAPALVEDGFRVLAPDLIGYGGSRAPPAVEPDMETQASFLSRLLDHLGIRRIAVVAHDVGTAAAQILAAREPERIAALALVDGVYGAEWAMNAVGEIKSWQEPARLHRVLLRRLRTSGPTRLPEEAARAVLCAYEGEEGGLRLIRAARALRPEQTVAIMPRLRERRFASLVLWGKSDPYLSADTVGRPLAELLGAEFTQLEGGHFLPLDAPRAVALCLRQFLQSARVRSARER